jgi:hypothetical protein
MPPHPRPGRGFSRTQLRAARIDDIGTSTPRIHGFFFVRIDPFVLFYGAGWEVALAPEGEIRRPPGPHGRRRAGAAQTGNRERTGLPAAPCGSTAYWTGDGEPVEPQPAPCGLTAYWTGDRDSVERQPDAVRIDGVLNRRL